jgi:hypothetical protein
MARLGASLGSQDRGPLPRDERTREFCTSLSSRPMCRTDRGDAVPDRQKQRIRNLIAPSQNLGHSDKPVASTLSSTQPQIPATEPDTTPANTTAEMQRSAVPPKSAEDVDLSALAEQPLKPLTEDDFAPRYRCM